MSTIVTRPLIIGHRGASAVAPENTFTAFRQAVEVGADGIEFDVRLSKDGVPVVIHDRSLERTGRKFGLVADCTAAELGKLDVGSWFNATYPRLARDEYSRESVPTLMALLAQLRSFTGVIYIELKCDNDIAKLSQEVCDVIRHSGLAPQIVVKSFTLGVIPYFKIYCPAVKTAALFAPKVMRYLRKEKHLVKIATEFGADRLSLHYSLVTGKLMKKVEKAGLPVTIWTADNPRWVTRAQELGIDSVITNEPARLLERRNGLAVISQTY
ncbi:MAG: glycerophosphodiester phosphodiesterase family protein [Pyrinomonadaceae bacterium]